MSLRKLLVFALVVAGAGLLLAGLTLIPARTRQAPTPADAHSPADSPPRAFGWIDDPDSVRETLVLMKCGRFCETAAFASPDDGPEDVFLWDACRQATGDVLPARDQKSVGCCVGFAAASAVEHLMCVQAAGGSGEEYRDLAAEIIYAGSRVEIGGNRVRGDGTVGGSGFIGGINCTGG